MNGAPINGGKISPAIWQQDETEVPPILIPVGNPANPRLRRKWEMKHGRPWPKTEGGRNFDVAHERALADGGKDTLDNIKPMHPDAHAADHRARNDFARWGKRPGIARAFGGRVGGALGPFGPFSDILGIISGRVRTDTFDNYASDLMGVPSQEDRRKELEHQQRQLNPAWKPGDPIVI